jgi:thiamine-phosphate pyrophosphorylase
VIPRLHYIANYRGGSDQARLLDVLNAVLEAGVLGIQLRAKAVSDAERLQLARRVSELCRQAGAILIVNDRVDIAVASGSDGAHVGPDDLPPAEARRILGPDLILGASARTVERARLARDGGASYLGVGPCYATTTKEGLPDPIGPGGLRVVAEAVDIPVIAIGGVTADGILDLLEAGAHGVAVIGAIDASDEPRQAAEELMARIGALT